MFFWILANKILSPAEEGILSPLVEAEPLQEMAPMAPGELGLAFTKMLFTFVVLIALLFATYWFIRRLIQQRLQKGVGAPSIQILEKRMISAKTTLYLVEVENKKVLLAESHLEVKRLESFSSEHPSH